MKEETGTSFLFTWQNWAWPQGVGLGGTCQTGCAWDARSRNVTGRRRGPGELCPGGE